jgi:hypothetical protein
MSLWSKLLGERGGAPRCARCGGDFPWPDSFKSGPIPIPAHIVDTALFCADCNKTYCIRCVRGKCPDCGGSNYSHVTPPAA